jgi:hypothetical protein
MKLALAAAALAVGLFLGLLLGRGSVPLPAARAGAEPAPASAVTAAQVEGLQKEIKKLHGLVPDQAAIMSHLAYHWSNFYFAVQNENWPLADFYLSETRANLKWAVRSKPLRKDLAGKETVDVAKIGEAMDNGPFTDLKKAVTARDRKYALKLYNDALSGCYACHKASYKPYLRPQVPTAPEARVVNFDPKAKDPM